MYTYANGFTKETVLAQLKKYNTGEQAQESNGYQCVYRAPDGNRCFIGCFIPDDEERALKTRGDVLALLLAYPHLEASMPLEKDALFDFQALHDDFEESRFVLPLHAKVEEWLTNNVKET